MEIIPEGVAGAPSKLSPVSLASSKDLIDNRRSIEKRIRLPTYSLIFCFKDRRQLF